MTIDDYADILRSHRYRFTNEDELQRGIAEVLLSVGCGFSREFPSRVGRIDFLLAGGICLEVKVDGSRAALLRQLSRYARSGQFDGLIVVASRRRLIAEFPAELEGVPLQAVLAESPL